MKSLRISRVFPHYSLDLIDCRLYRHEAGETVRAELRGLRELRTAVQEQFDLPRLPVEAAVAVLERLTGRPFFPA
jgi:arylamine N-acetyltransferase